MLHHSRENSSSRWTARLILGVVLGLLAALLIRSPVFASELSEYIASPDPAYSYKLVKQVNGLGYQVHTLEMISQQWPAAGYPRRQPWKHALTIIVPDKVATDTAIMVINGGSNDGELSSSQEELTIFSSAAVVTKSVFAVLNQVPNQPLAFEGDAQSYSEDYLVARSWDQHMRTGDPAYNVYLPMTKAAVRALDTVQDYTRSATNKPIKDFVLTGFSKRGAIVYLTAALDARVRALAPGVFAPNFAAQIEHHFASYGQYSSAVEPYAAFDTIQRIRTPEGRDLMKLVDPYAYRALLSKPKFLSLSSGDQFFVVDGARFFVDDLPGETRIRYVPNSDHSLSTSKGVLNGLVSMLSWFQAIQTNQARPTLTWVRMPDGGLRVRAPGAAYVKLWQATNPNGRDFRREVIGEAWTAKTILPGVFDGLYKVGLPAPSSGWTAYFMEASYVTKTGLQTYSTPIYIAPDVLPFALNSPLKQPKDASFWTQRLSQGAGNDPLAAQFPLPVLGQYIQTVNAAAQQLSGYGPGSLAMQQCLTARLNIASGELGWYSHVGGLANAPYVWQTWLDAFDAYQAGDTQRAATLCAGLNMR